MNKDVVTREEITAWEKHCIGKPCPNHPTHIMKEGKYGMWCGVKTDLGNWCSCSWPSEEWLINYRKEHNG